MTVELNSEAIVKAFGLNRTIASARINAGGGTPVLLDNLGIKSVTHASNSFTVTFMHAFNTAPIFFGAAQNPTDNSFALVTLTSYNAEFTTATVQLFAAASGAAPAEVNTDGIIMHLLFFGERR